MFVCACVCMCSVYLYVVFVHDYIICVYAYDIHSVFVCV